MSNVLVTGGAGYIGSHVVNRLLKKGYDVTIIDNLSSGSKQLLPKTKKVSFYNIDICNHNLLLKLFKKKKFKKVFHFAASINVTESQKYPQKYYVNNVFGTENILSLCQKFKTKSFVFSSTCAVYGSVCGSVKETLVKKPENYYGKTKNICEELIKNYSKISNFNFAILRYFNVVGADPSNNLGQISSESLFKKISKNIILKKYKFNIYGKNYKTLDGTCIRDYIDVNDLADLHILSLKKISKSKKNLIMNCGYNKGLSVKQIIDAFSKEINRKIKIHYLSRRDGDIEKIWSNNSNLRKIFPNWKRKYTLSKSIENALKWERMING